MSQFQRGLVVGDMDMDEFSHIDFDKLEGKTQLVFNEEVRQDIRYRLSMYEFELRSTKNISAEDVKRRLKRVVSACELLEPILRSCAEVREGIDDLDLLQAVRTWSSPKSPWAYDKNDNVEVMDQLPDEHEIAEFLHLWRDLAIKAAEKRSKKLGGRPYNQALLNLLHGLHNIFRNAGGEGRGCYPSSYSNDDYAGPFLEFAYGLLDYTSTKIPKSQLADYIVKRYKIEP